MTNTMYEYARVFTKEQNETKQMIAMKEFGVEDQWKKRRILQKY